MSQQTPTPEELILAMLREVLARQAQQMGLKTPPPAATPPPAPKPATPAVTPPPTRPATPPPVATAYPEAPDPMTPREAEELAEYNELAARPLAPGSLPRTLRLFAVGLVLAIILINLPIFNGLALARALPDRQALIIRDGLLLKGSGPEVYMLQDNQKRWVSSLTAFRLLGHKWDEVHIVDDAFLAQFPDGRSIHALLKCADSPHIYRIERDQKRWIKDIPTFEAEGHVWADVHFVTCDELRAIPDGPPLPPGAGPPPQP